MNSELIKAWAEILNALAWPVAIIIIIPILMVMIWHLIKNGGIFHFKTKAYEVHIEPAKGSLVPTLLSGNAYRI